MIEQQIFKLKDRLSSKKLFVSFLRLKPVFLRGRFCLWNSSGFYNIIYRY